MLAMPLCPGRMADDQGEMLDLVDENDRVVGTVRRGAVHGNPGLRHRAVHVFVRSRGGEIFLQKRAAGKLVAPGKWDTSVGGHLAAGQSYEEAARREMEEELGISGEAMPSLRHSHDYVWQNEVETEHIRTFIAEAEGPFELNSAEIEEGRFWAVEELRRALGTGVLSPNLETELGYLGIRRS